MWDRLFASVDMLQRGMEVSWKRNSVIRNNLANSETPGFKSSDIEFESILARSLETTNTFDNKRTRERHIEFGDRVDFFSVEPVVVQNENLSMRMDGNNVDVENENVKLAQNSIQYNTMLEKLNSELRRINMAISEGR